MTILALNWQTAHHFGAAWISHHRLRHRMFIDRQNWPLPRYAGLEFDRFDTPAAIYLLWCDAAGEAQGSLRLVPTTQPYMVASLWPDLLAQPCPESATVWEASRFGCHQALPPHLRRRIVAELICAALEFAVLAGITRYLVVMPPWIFHRLLIPCGCGLTLAGAPRIMSGRQVAAAYIEADPAALVRVRQSCALEEAVLDRRATDLLLQAIDTAATGMATPWGAAGGASCVSQTPAAAS